MEPLLINYVKDKVSEIREAVTLKLDALIAVYKNEWVFQRLLPKLNEYMSKDNSLDYCNGGNLLQFLTKNKSRLAED